jgi:hypothetical protein
MDLFGKLEKEIVCGVLFTNPVGTSADEVTFARPAALGVAGRVLPDESVKNDAP